MRLDDVSESSVQREIYLRALRGEAVEPEVIHALLEYIDELELELRELRDDNDGQAELLRDVRNELRAKSAGAAGKELGT